MYLIFITVGMCASYFTLFYLFPYFFNNKITRLNSQFLYSILYITVLSLLGYVVVFSIPHEEWSNRILHGFSGGFLSFFVCFLAARDSRVSLSRFQFFLFSFLIVTALGVVNEIFEFIGQGYFHIEFAFGVFDTWLDLVSNWTGAVLAALCFVPFLNKPKR